MKLLVMRRKRKSTFVDPLLDSVYFAWSHLECIAHVSRNFLVVFSSVRTHREDDGGGLDSADDERRQELDAEACATRTTDRDLRIRPDGIRLLYNHCAAVLRPIGQTLDESYGSRQTIATADVLLLRYRQQPAIRADVRHPGHDDLSGCHRLHVGGRLYRAHCSSHLWPVGELQGPIG